MVGPTFAALLHMWLQVLSLWANLCIDSPAVSFERCGGDVQFEPHAVTFNVYWQDSQLPGRVRVFCFEDQRLGDPIAYDCGWQVTKR